MFVLALAPFSRFDKIDGLALNLVSFSPPCFFLSLVCSKTPKVACGSFSSAVVSSEGNLYHWGKPDAFSDDDPVTDTRHLLPRCVALAAEGWDGILPKYVCSVLLTVDGGACLAIVELCLLLLPRETRVSLHRAWCCLGGAGSDALFSKWCCDFQALSCGPRFDASLNFTATKRGRDLAFDDCNIIQVGGAPGTFSLG